MDVSVWSVVQARVGRTTHARPPVCGHLVSKSGPGPAVIRECQAGTKEMAGSWALVSNDVQLRSRVDTIGPHPIDIWGR